MGKERGKGGKEREREIDRKIRGGKEGERIEGRRCKGEKR